MTDSDVQAGTWKPLPGASHIEVCDVGGWVVALPRTVNGRRYPGGLLTPMMTGTSRYWQVQYTDNRGVRRKRPVHILVLEAHDRLRPPGREGCHNDGDLNNNDRSNLRWDWPEANRADRYRQSHPSWLRRVTKWLARRGGHRA